MLIKELNTQAISDFLNSANKDINIYSPWISDFGFSILKSIISEKPEIKINIFTRFKVEDFVLGVSDIKGLNELKRKSYNIKFYQNNLLHAKIYIIDNSKTFFGSCNFTLKAFSENYEIGFISDLTNEFTEHISNWQFNEITQVDINLMIAFINEIKQQSLKVNEPLNEKYFDYKQLLYRIGLR